MSLFQQLFSPLLPSSATVASSHPFIASVSGLNSGGNHWSTRRQAILNPHSESNTVTAWPLSSGGRNTPISAFLTSFEHINRLCGYGTMIARCLHVRANINRVVHRAMGYTEEPRIRIIAPLEECDTTPNTPASQMLPATPDGNQNFPQVRPRPNFARATPPRVAWDTNASPAVQTPELFDVSLLLKDTQTHLLPPWPFTPSHSSSASFGHSNGGGSPSSNPRALLSPLQGQNIWARMPSELVLPPMTASRALAPGSPNLQLPSPRELFKEMYNSKNARSPPESLTLLPPGVFGNVPRSLEAQPSLSPRSSCDTYGSAGSFDAVRNGCVHRFTIDASGNDYSRLPLTFSPFDDSKDHLYPSYGEVRVPSRPPGLPSPPGLAKPALVPSRPPGLPRIIKVPSRPPGLPSPIRTPLRPAVQPDAPACLSFFSTNKALFTPSTVSPEVATYMDFHHPVVIDIPEIPPPAPVLDPLVFPGLNGIHLGGTNSYAATEPAHSGSQGPRSHGEPVDAVHAGPVSAMMQRSEQRREDAGNHPSYDSFAEDEDEDEDDQAVRQANGYSSDRQSYPDEVSHDGTTYYVVGTLGEGGVGRVFLAVTNAMEVVALKVMHKPRCYRRPEAPSELIFERNCMVLAAELELPFWTRLRAAWEDQLNVYYAMDTCTGSLRDRIRSTKSPISEYEERLMCAEMLLAVRDLRVQQMVHADIKPDNFLVTRSGQVLLSDFGFCQSPREASSAFKVEKLTDQAFLDWQGPSPGGTPGYLAPEVVHDGVCTHSTDIWTLGLVFLELMARCANPLLQESEDPALVDWDMKVTPEQLPRDSDRWDLCMAMLSKSNRPSVEQLMQHPYFDGLDFDAVYRGEVKHEYRPSINRLTVGEDDRDLEFKDWHVGRRPQKMSPGVLGRLPGPLVDFEWPRKGY